jgi:hypothetical protein
MGTNHEKTYLRASSWQTDDTILSPTKTKEGPPEQQTLGMGKSWGGKSWGGGGGGGGVGDRTVIGGVIVLRYRCI